MLMLAQALGEYGGAGGGIVGAIERLATTVVEVVRASIADDTVFWLVGACAAGWLLFRRR